MRNKSQITYGIIMALAVLAAGSLLIYCLSYLFTAKAHAAEWPFAETPYAYLGVEHEADDTFCEPNGTNYVANAGFGQTLFKRQQYQLDIKYTHHSCAFWFDQKWYDGVGLHLQWYPWRSH